MRNVILVLVLEFFLCVSGIKLKAFQLKTDNLPTSPRRQRILTEEKKLPDLENKAKEAKKVFRCETDKMNRLLEEIKYLNEWREKKKPQAFAAKSGLFVGGLLSSIASSAFALAGRDADARFLLGASESASKVSDGIEQAMKETKERLIKMREEFIQLKQNVKDADKNWGKARSIYSAAISEINYLINERNSERFREKMLIIPNLKRIIALNKMARKASHECASNGSEGEQRADATQEEVPVVHAEESEVPAVPTKIHVEAELAEDSESESESA